MQSGMMWGETTSPGAMTVTVHLQPGETIRQALIRTLIRAGLMAPPGDKDPETITIPPGTYIISNGDFRKTRIVERRTTGIPFLKQGDQP
jgi:hypothetical protein